MFLEELEAKFLPKIALPGLRLMECKEWPIYTKAFYMASFHYDVFRSTFGIFDVQFETCQANGQLKLLFLGM